MLLVRFFFMIDKDCIFFERERCESNVKIVFIWNIESVGILFYLG